MSARATCVFSDARAGGGRDGCDSVSAWGDLRVGVCVVVVLVRV